MKLILLLLKENADFLRVRWYWRVTIWVCLLTEAIYSKSNICKCDVSIAVTFRESPVSRSLFLGIASFSLQDHQLRITLKQSINGSESFATCRSHGDHFEFADHSWKALTKRCFDGRWLILVLITNRRENAVCWYFS